MFYFERDLLKKFFRMFEIHPKSKSVNKTRIESKKIDLSTHIMSMMTALITWYLLSDR